MIVLDKIREFDEALAKLDPSQPLTVEQARHTLSCCWSLAQWCSSIIEHADRMAYYQGKATHDLQIEIGMGGLP